MVSHPYMTSLSLVSSYSGDRRQELRPSPRKRNTKKLKWLSKEALQIAVKKREEKRKEEKERYTHLNAEFQRIARRDKKAFFSKEERD